MTGVILRLLGPLEVVGPERVVTPPPGRVASLLGLLAMEVGRVVSLDRLMDQLWDQTPQSGSATLHVYVSRLRRLLKGTDVRIVTRSPGYLLDLPRLAVDAHLLAERLSEAEQAAAESNWLRALERVGQARDLRRGEPFVDAYRCADLEIEAERLEKQFIRLDELEVRSLLALDRPAEAYASAEGLTRRDRLNETYWRLRIRSAQRLGNVASGLADFEEFRTLLADELGLDPSERMAELHLELLRGEAAPPSRADPQPDTPPPPDAGLTASPSPLTPTARQAERADLDDAVRGAIAGVGRTVVLEGEPGIGKSFLATYAAGAAREAGVKVIWARAMDGPGTPPLWMWEQILGALVTNRPNGRASGADELRALAGSGTEGASDPEQARFRLSEAIVARVVAASGEQPLLLVLDDVQWADDSTLYTLRLLAQALSELPCSMVLTARTGSATAQLLETTLASVTRESGSSRHRLAPFSMSDVESYLHEQVARDSAAHGPGDPKRGAAGADPERVAQLHQRSGGNPFFLSELLRSGPTGARTPGTVTGLVNQRRSQLDVSTRAVLDLAAVAGSTFDALVVAHALGQSLVEVVALMDPAEDEGFVVIDPESRSWRFAHDLAREAILGTISPVRRAELHAALADAITDVNADDLDDHLDELADHRFRAVGGSPSAAAFAACQAAADRAVRRLAYDQAALHRSRALATLELGPVRRPERFEVLIRLTTERRLAGDVVGAAASLRQAIELARLIGDRSLLTRAVTVLGGVTLWNWRQFEQVDHPTVALLEELLAAQASGAENDPAARRQRVELLGTLAVELYYDETRPRGEALATEAVALAREVGDPALLGRVLNNYVIAAWAPGRDAARRRALDESLALVGHGLPRATEVIARMHRGSLRVRAGDIAGFEEDLEQASWLAPRLGILEIEGQVNTQRAGLALLRGDLEMARELIDRAHHQLVRTSLWGADWTRLVQLTTLARTEGRVGDVADAVVAKASEDAHRTLRWTAVLAVAEASDLVQAQSLQRRWSLRTLAGQPHWSSTFEWAQAAETSLLLDSPGLAEVRTAVSTIDAELVVAGTAVGVWGSVADLEARLAARAGDGAAARRHGARATALTRQVRDGLGVRPSWPAAI